MQGKERNTMANVNWSSLGTPPKASIAFNATVAKHTDGRLEAFVMDSGAGRALWHRAQTSPGGAWNDWASLGTPAYTTNGAPGIPSQPVVVEQADGRLEVFIKGIDDGIWHIWQLHLGGEWSQWSSLGLAPDRAGFQPSISVGENVDGRLEVFAISQVSESTLWHIWQLHPGGGWSQWSSLGTTLQDGNSNSLVAGAKVGGNADGRLEVFVTGSEMSVTGSDRAVWHIWQLHPGGEWSKWSSLGTPPTAISLGNNCFVWKNDDGRIEIFVTSSAEVALWHFWQLTPGGSWSAWTSLGAPPSGIQSGPAVGKTKDGHFEVFVNGGDGALWQVTPGGNWISLGRPPNVSFLHYATPTVVENADRRLEVFQTNILNHELWHTW
jgi:hypothetical protein